MSHGTFNRSIVEPSRFSVSIPVERGSNLGTFLSARPQNKISPPMSFRRRRNPERLCYQHVMQLVATTFVLLAALRAAANPVTITSVLTVIPVPTTIVHYPNATYTLKGTGIGTSAGRYGSNSTLQRTLPYQTTHIARTITTTIATSNSLTTSSPNATVVEPTSLITSSGNATAIESTSLVSVTYNASATSLPEACAPNELYCNSPTSFSLCAPSAHGPPRYVDMGSVANGTVCTDGAIQRAGNGRCSPIGNLTCAANGMKFFMCDEGVLDDLFPCNED